MASLVVEIVLPIVQKIAGYLVVPIGRQFGYLFCYNSNIKNLTDQLEGLKSLKAEVQISIDAAKRNLEVIGGEADAWLTNVEEIKKEAEEVLAEVTSGVEKKGYCCPLRYLLSRKATKKTKVVLELQGEGKKYTEFSYAAAPSAGKESTLVSGSKAFESRISIVKDVIEDLKDDKVSIIGICGIGGVGKTTMVKDVATKVIADHLFDEVTFAVVSQTPDIIKVQDQLAEMLGLKFVEHTSIIARAHRLHERLTKGSRILVILDDVWESVSLEEVGLPDDGTHDWKGSKLVVTSRIEQSYSVRRTQKNFTVQILSHQEAWDLFTEVAGVYVETIDSELLGIADQVAMECGGLPLAIVTVGSALKGKEKRVWNDALGQLKKSTVTKTTGMELVHSRIKLSYDYLGSDQAKPLLLLCCLFPEDHNIPIEDLVRYGVGLRLFEDVDSLAEIRDRVYSSVVTLRRYYLLLAGDEEFVKMHDVIRDVGLSMASQGEHVYMVRHEKDLKEWPRRDTYEPYTAFSLTLYHEMLELPVCLNCPRLKLLRLGCRRSQGLQMSRDFFGEMKQMRVINFHGCNTSIEEPLPTSLEFLVNLQALCLDFCKLGSGLFLIGSLKNLEILSFYGSKLNVFPSEIARLGNLKLLDLRFADESNVHVIIPSGVLSRLSKLEELYLGSYFHAPVASESDDGADTKELNSLSCLKALQISVPTSGHLRKSNGVGYEELTRFNITLSDVKIPGDADMYQLIANSLHLKFTHVVELLETKIHALFRRTESLTLNVTRGLKNMSNVKELGEGSAAAINFGSLKKLCMFECDEVEYLVDIAAMAAAFLNLEELKLSRMNNLIEMCSRGNVPVGSFGRLRRLELEDVPVMSQLWRGATVQPPCLGNLRVVQLVCCNAIKTLFPQSIVKCLVQLQEVKIESCDMVEEIVSREDQERGREDKKNIINVEFPKLKSLDLQELRKFRCFYPQSGVRSSDHSSTEPIFNPQVILPSMETLKVDGMDNMVQIVGGQMNKQSVIRVDHCDILLRNLKKLVVSICNSLEAVFDFEGLHVQGEQAKVALGHLEKLELYNLPKLVNIWRMVSKGINGFHMLKTLKVSSCGSLRYLLSPSTTKLLVNLKDLEIVYCKTIEQVIEAEEINSSEIEMVDKIVFPRLQNIELQNLENLTMFCSRNIDFEFLALEKVHIERCPKMRIFCSGSLSTPMDMRVIERHNDQPILTSNLNSTILKLKSARDGPTSLP